MMCVCRKQKYRARKRTVTYSRHDRAITTTTKHKKGAWSPAKAGQGLPAWRPSGQKCPRGLQPRKNRKSVATGGRLGERGAWGIYTVLETVAARHNKTPIYTYRAREKYTRNMQQNNHDNSTHNILYIYVYMQRMPINEQQNEHTDTYTYTFSNTT